MEEQLPKDSLTGIKLSKNRNANIKYHPNKNMLELITRMKKCIKKKNQLIKLLKQKLKGKNDRKTVNVHSQTDPVSELGTNNSNEFPTNETYIKTNDSGTIVETEPIIKTNEVNVEAGWNIKDEAGEKSIADQVKEVAQSALQQTGMVYVESAGMYYDYKTGYYYNSELGLYYHTDTNCYYYYSDEKQSFVFHSYPERTIENPGLAAHNKKKARKHKVQQKEDVIENLTKNLSQDNEDGQSRPKRRKTSKKLKKSSETNGDKEPIENSENIEKDSDSEEKQSENSDDKLNTIDLEDGECSDTSYEEAGDDNDDGKLSDDSNSTLSDDDNVAKHHPPCMRVIIRETSLPKLKVGSLFLITKDGGTVGREGDTHTIILRDQNVSRNHLHIEYNIARQSYTAMDLGSKNGTILNGTRMSESQVVSKPIDVMHGSTIQIGESKLLCHIHPGNDTCGHCEPGLIMATEEKEKKVAYTRTCSVQRQHQLELARLKNKYAPKVLCIEETAYNDRAEARRAAVGSSHHAEKTQTNDLDTSIAPENKGFKLLQKMGWSKGEGLGKDNQGDTEPVPLISNEGKAGLGTPGATNTPSIVPIKTVKNTLGPATLRLATRTKMLNPPAKAFSQNDDEESE